MITISVEYVRVDYEEGLKKEGPDFDPIDRAELSKIDRKASSREVSRKLASLYAEGMARAVDEQLKAIDEARDGLFTELMESLPEGTDERLVKKELTKNAKATSNETVLLAIYDAAKTPQFYRGMQVAVAMAAQELGRGDIEPCRINSKDLKDATVYFSKLVLKYGIAHGVMPTKFDERNVRRAVKDVKRQADAIGCVGYG